jgi:hypothetical protein
VQLLAAANIPEKRCKAGPGRALNRVGPCNQWFQKEENRGLKTAQIYWQVVKDNTLAISSD